MILLHQGWHFTADIYISAQPKVLCTVNSTKGKVHLPLKRLQTSANFFPLAIKGTQTGQFGCTHLLCRCVERR